MRVITGSAHGKNLITPEGLDVRPTVARVKEAVFSSLQFDIEGRNILDLFAGSGQIGIEALSRGAKHCWFVDNSRTSLGAIRNNITNCNLESKATIVEKDSFSFIETTNQVFDIVYLDPPYNKCIINRIMPNLVEKMSDYGIIVCEYADKNELAENYGEFHLKKTSKYGKIFVSYFKKGED
ncbi:MAG: 16S rRNA (guanine(966)-N(2))-methyltransferase RsmD [Clostridia bacterium]|nr:16S rRNA (guanine(966)-N(2))-methyltransferase RsmD [Clostridia bacterium]